jgi:hypothetical protein
MALVIGPASPWAKAIRPIQSLEGEYEMKSVNRKIVLMALLGILVVAPFLLIASAVGLHAVAFAGNARPEAFCLLVALVSIAARISDGHLALANIAEERD